MSVILVGEIGINHNGDMRIAKELIRVADFAKLDYVKFQKRDIQSVYTKEFLDSPRESPWGTTQRVQKEALEFEEYEYLEISEYVSRQTNLLGWFASPWDPESANFLDKLDCTYMKIASAMTTNFDLLEEVKKTGRPVIISTGMSTKEEVDACVDFMGDQIEFILSCNSTYPTKDEDMNMKFIKTLKKEYPSFKIGFSNHNSGIQFCLCAVALGAEMVEFHMTVDRSMYGSDQAASIETNGILKIGSHARAIEKATGNGAWGISAEEEKVRNKLRGK